MADSVPAVVLRHAIAVDSSGWRRDYEIAVDNGRIVDLRPDRGRPLHSGEHDLSGRIVIPGLVDLHVHGALGADFRYATPSDFERIIDYHRRHGTTTMLATLASLSAPDLLRALGQAAQAISGAVLRPTVIGVHLEGPFISTAFRGAHPERSLRPATRAELGNLASAASGTIRLVTFAPEIEGADELLAFAQRHEVVAALGHTAATFEQAALAVDLGVRHVTHSFNAMYGIGKRAPGPLAAALDDERVTLEIVADGYHVHPSVLRLLYRAAGKSRLVLVTDASACAGLADGTYSLGGRRLTIARGMVTLAGTGTIAGSSLTMIDAVRNAIRFLGIGLDVAVTMASSNPARVLGLDHRKGRIAIGYDADLVVLDPELAPLGTMIRGAWTDAV